MTGSQQAPRRTWQEVVEFCLDPRLLRRTFVTALVVGTTLSLINQAQVITQGDATIATWVRIALNFVVPFVVVNVGALAGSHTE